MEKRNFEVLLLVGRGGTDYFPRSIPVRLTKGKPYPYNRMGDIIDIIREEGENNGVRWDKVVPDDAFKNNAGKIMRIIGEYDYFYTFNEDNGQTMIYAIKNMTNETPWTIMSNPDTGEYIHFFKKGELFRIKDTSLNYGVYLEGAGPNMG